MELRRVCVDPATVVITQKRLEKSRSNYVARAFSCQRPPQRQFRATQKAGLPELPQRSTASQSCKFRSSSLYQQLYPQQRLFKGSVLDYGRRLGRAQESVDKELAKEVGVYEALERRQSSPNLVLLRNHFMGVRNQLLSVIQGAYTGDNLPAFFAFLLDVCRFLRVARSKATASEQRMIASALLTEETLKMVLIALISQVLSHCGQAVNTSLALLYLVLDSDDRAFNLPFMGQLLRSVGKCFLSKLLVLVDNERIGVVTSLLLTKLISRDLVSFGESGLLKTPCFLAPQASAENVQNVQRFDMDKQISADYVGPIISGTFAPRDSGNLERYTLKVDSDCDEDVNCYFCVFKHRPDTTARPDVRDFATVAARALSEFGVRRRSVVQRKVSENDLQHDLKVYVESNDFDSFSRRNRLFLKQSNTVYFSPEDNKDVCVFRCNKPFFEFAFDVYGGMTGISFMLLANTSCRRYKVHNFSFGRWQVPDRPPIANFLAPQCCYRQKARERAVLRKYGHSLIGQRIDFVKGGVVELAELVSLLSNKQGEIEHEQLPIGGFEELQRDGDLLFGSYAETVTMIQQLEDLGLSVSNYRFPTLTEATQDLCDQLLEKAAYGATYRGGTLGMIAEKLWTECKEETLQGLERRSGE